MQLIEKNEKSLVNLLSLILYLNLIKAPVDFYLNGIYRLVTLLSYILIAWFLFKYNKLWSNKLDVLSLTFIGYLIFRFIIEIPMNNTAIIQSAIPLVKFISYILLIIIIGKNKFSDSCKNKIIDRTIVFFIVTIIVSVIQTFPGLPMHNIFSYYGANVLSGTPLGNVRVSGGIGGTVIDYAVFIIFNMMIYCSVENRLSNKKRIIYLGSIILASIMNYSRVTFLCFGIIFGIYYLLIKLPNVSIYRKLVHIFAVITILTLLFNSSNDLVKYAFVSDEHRQQSNEGRIDSSLDSISLMDNPLKKLIGVSMGQNTGLPVNSYKTLGDGFIISFLYDFGFIGLILLILHFINIFKLVIFSYSNIRYQIFFAGLLISFFVMNTINSGFNANINIIFFCFVFLLMLNKRGEIE